VADPTSLMHRTSIKTNKRVFSL